MGIIVLKLMMNILQIKVRQIIIGVTEQVIGVLFRGQSYLSFV